MPPQAMSSHSMGGAQAVALDHTADSDEESPFPKTSQCRMMKGSPKKVWPDPIWEAIKWLEVHVETLREEDVQWWPLVAPLTDEGALAPGSSLCTSWPHGSGWLRWPLPSFVHPPPLC